MKIQDHFVPSDVMHTPYDPPTINIFTQVLEDAVNIFGNSPTKSFMLDP